MHTQAQAATILAQLAARGPHTELDAVRALTDRPQPRVTPLALVRIPAQRVRDAVPRAGAAPTGLVES